MLTQLSAHTGAWAALFDAQGNELFSAGPRPPAPLPQLVCDLAVRTTARATRRQAPGRPLLDTPRTWLTLHGSWGLSRVKTLFGLLIRPFVSCRQAACWYSLMSPPSS